MGINNIRNLTRVIGYARVSTSDQDISLQLDALEPICDFVFQEKVSSGKTRPQLEECLRHLQRGDTFVVHSLDRIGRSTVELIRIVNSLKDKGVNFMTLKENIETRSALGTLFFHIIASLAEFEKSNLSERTKAGLAAARARGRNGGRPSKVSDKAIIEMKVLYDSQTMTVGEICKRYKISSTTFYAKVLGKDYKTKPQTKSTTKPEKPS